MKFLAIEKEIENVNWDNAKDVLKEEAKRVLQLYEGDILREVYFTEHNDAVGILECDSRETAVAVLNSLPLVREKYIDFELVQLLPDPGFRRIIED